MNSPIAEAGPASVRREKKKRDTDRGGEPQLNKPERDPLLTEHQRDVRSPPVTDTRNILTRLRLVQGKGLGGVYAAPASSMMKLLAFARLPPCCQNTGHRRAWSLGHGGHDPHLSSLSSSASRYLSASSFTLASAKQAPGADAKMEPNPERLHQSQTPQERGHAAAADRTRGWQNACVRGRGCLE